MIWFKACPKCQGDLCLDSDHFGKFKTCLQCGYCKDLIEPDRATLPAMKLSRPKAPSREILVAAD